MQSAGVHELELGQVKEHVLRGWVGGAPEGLSQIIGTGEVQLTGQDQHHLMGVAHHVDLQQVDMGCVVRLEIHLRVLARRRIFGAPYAATRSQWAAVLSIAA